MAKVLLIEDDTNLREIFAMRLQAEGYETLSAGDGEEGLVVAMKQKPDLIIADVMMPKLSGFEMLETLRGTPEMGNIKVIMMTALGQAEDRARGEKLGVVKYLVKSQVTLEDFVRVVKEVLQPGGQAENNKTGSVNELAQTNRLESEKTMQDDQNANSTGMPASDGQPAADSSAMPAADSQMSTADEQSTVQSQINDAMGSEPAAPAADAGSSTPPASDSGMGSDAPASDAGADSSAPADGAGTPPAAPAA